MLLPFNRQTSRVSAPPCPPAEEGLIVVPRRGQWAMLVSLIFFVGPVQGAISGLPAGRMAVTLVLGIAAIAVYWRLMVGGWVIRDRLADNEEHAPQLLALLGALSLALSIVGGADWCGIWCFVGAALGLRMPRQYAIPLLFVAAAGAAVTVSLNGVDDASAPVSLFIVTIGVGMLTGGFRRLRTVSVELNQARDEIGRLAVDDERLRFARDLHDLLGHSLSVIALKSELANRLIQDRPDQAAEHMRDIEAVTRRALSEVREAVAGYRRPALHAELAGARSTLVAAGIDVDAGPPPAVELPPDAEAVLAWAIREGATNVLRHSEASRVRISFDVTRDDATLTLTDDGHACPDAQRESDGTGLAGLAERVARVRGRLDAAPRDDGDGFRLHVTVPLEAVS
jgi:two-component system sensor histidine kinase DesK